ncbi:hypothetical protein [Alkalihalobacillus sp. TS-13]|uniref:hypothetical protein n=1 Tax=Alkalihalobacillus sp. TS-13 TaxID=2842455 RepID=UPI001C875B22|nr:hypothetical protein [Alkalihalobacillus sp. TS-13]
MNEYDPGSGNDDYIGKLRNKDLRGYTTFNISNFIDGPNNKAEIYVMSYKIGGPYKALNLYAPEFKEKLE